MGHRAGRVHLDQVRFSLVPKVWEPDNDGPQDDPETINLQGLYSLCYQTIFESNPKDNIERVPNVRSKLAILADDLGCSIKLIFLTVMMAHSQTEDTTPFYANMLLGPSARRRVEMYREHCRQTWGCFDIKSIGRVFNKQVSKYDSFFNCDVLFGTTIVGLRLKKSVDPTPVVFADTEPLYDPAWLAIEPNYLEVVLKPHIQARTCSKVLEQHRFRVSRIRSEFLKNKQKAIEAFQSRESTLPRAVEEVLRRHQLNPRNLLTRTPIVTDVVQFWSRVAFAIQHLRCLDFVDGNEESFKGSHVNR